MLILNRNRLKCNSPKGGKNVVVWQRITKNTPNVTKDEGEKRWRKTEPVLECTEGLFQQLGTDSSYIKSL